MTTRIMRSKPDKAHRLHYRWYRHIQHVQKDMAHAARKGWTRRLADWYRDFLGWYPQDELRGLMHFLLVDDGPVHAVINIAEYEQGLSDLAIARTALTYRDNEPVVREQALARLVRAEHRLVGARR